MSEMMQKTFSSLYEIHPSFIDSENAVKEIINKAKPDLVIFTLAERQSLTVLGKIAPFCSQSTLE